MAKPPSKIKLSQIDTTGATPGDYLKVLADGSLALTPVAPGGGGSGSGAIGDFTFTPALSAIPAEGLEGTVLSAASISGITGPIFSELSAQGFVKVTAAGQLQAGPVSLDYTVGSPGAFKLRVQDGTNTSAKEASFSVPVAPEVGNAAPLFDFNFVTGINLGGNPTADITVAQSVARSEKKNDGSLQAFAANTLRVTDLGWWVSNEVARYIGPWALQPTIAHWGAMTPDWANGAMDTAAGAALATPEFPHPAILSATNGAATAVQVAAETLAVNDNLVVQLGLKFLTGDANADDELLMRVSWTGGYEEFMLTHLNPTDPVAIAPVFWSNAYGSTPASADFSVVTMNREASGDPITRVYIQYHNSSIANNQVSVSLSPRVKNGTLGKIGLMGLQQVKANGPKAFRDNTAAVAVDTADDNTAGGNVAVVANSATGWMMFETQAVSRAFTGGITGLPLKVGATRTLEIMSSTTMRANGSAEAMRGLSGFRGIMRGVITWDATDTRIWLSGGQKLTIPGALPHAGVVKLFAEMGCRVRRLAGGTTKLTDAEGLRKSQIENRVFVRPGAAWVPGFTRETLNIPQPGNAMLTRPDTWPAAVPAYGVNGGIYASDVSNLYKPDYIANPTHHLIPRAHFYGRSPIGTYDSPINGEPQHYNDPAVAGSYNPYSVGPNGELIITAKLTADLTAPQQALVPINPGIAGGATKYEFVSGIVGTWQDLNAGGWRQKGGSVSVRAQLPAFYGSWGAIWLYSEDSSEMDVEEYYGKNPGITTSRVHSRNFAFNNGDDVVIGFNLGLTYHDYTIVQDYDTLKAFKYVDGELIDTMDLEPAYIINPQFLYLNLAIAPFHYSEPGGGATTRAAVTAGQAVMKVSHIRALQFGNK
jgi:hypothetical protein